MSIFTWDAVAIDVLKNLTLGGYSAAHVARVLGKGVTRNAVISARQRYCVVCGQPPLSRRTPYAAKPKAPPVRFASIPQPSVIVSDFIRPPTKAQLMGGR